MASTFELDELYILMCYCIDELQFHCTESVAQLKRLLVCVQDRVATVTR